MNKKEATPVELYCIQRVKEKRIEAGMSQRKLSLSLGLDANFVNHVESYKYKEKYNINHLNAIAAILKCSIRDIIPQYPRQNSDSKYILE